MEVTTFPWEVETTRVMDSMRVVNPAKAHEVRMRTHIQETVNTFRHQDGAFFHEPRNIAELHTG